MLIFCRKYLMVFLLFASVLGNTVFSQSPTLLVTIDSNDILIGGQFHLKVTTTFSPNAFSVKWLSIPDTLQHFELIASAKPDSVYTDNGVLTLSQTFTLTSFDSGKWNLPVFRINFRRLNDDADISLFTDSLPVTVSFSVADTTSTLKDIKPVYDVSVDYPIWYWIVGGLLLLLIIGLSFWAYRYWKKKPSSITPVSKLVAYDEAIYALEALGQYQLSAPDQVKIYHTKLVEIFKNYLSAIASTNHFNKATSDLLILLNTYTLDKAHLAKAATSLRCSDAVKFAKYLPATEDSIESRLIIKEIIVWLNKKTVTAGSAITKQI